MKIKSVCVGITLILTFIGSEICVGRSVIQDEYFPLGVYWPWMPFANQERNRHAQSAGLDIWEYADQVMRKLSENNFNLIMMAMNSVYGYFRHFDPTREFWLIIRPHNLPYAMRYLQRDILLTVNPYFFFHLCAWTEHRLEQVDQGLTWGQTCQRATNEQVNMASRLAQTYDRPFMLMPQVFTGTSGGGKYFDPEKRQIAVLPGTFLNWRQPTPSETTWQIWNGLAKGAKGFVTFTLFHGYDLTREDFVKEHGESVANGEEMFRRHPDSNVTEIVWIDDGLVRRGLEMTPQFHALGRLNGQLAPFSKMLSAGKPAPPLCFIDNDNQVATFEYGGDIMAKKYYAVVVNNDTENAVRQEIKTLPSVRKVTNLLTGDELEGGNSGFGSEFLTFTVDIEPGGGAILAVDLPAGDAYSRIDYLEFVSGYEHNRRTAYDNLTINPTPEGRERPSLRVESNGKTGFLTYRFQGTGDKVMPIVPTRYADGKLFFAFNANGLFKVSFLNESNEVIMEDELTFSHPIEASAEKLLAAPETTWEMKFEFLSDESTLMEASLLYSYTLRDEE